MYNRNHKSAYYYIHLSLLNFSLKVWPKETFEISNKSFWCILYAIFISDFAAPSEMFDILFWLSANSLLPVVAGCPPHWKHPVDPNCFGTWGSHTVPLEHWLGQWWTVLSPAHCPTDMRTPESDKISLNHRQYNNDLIIGYLLALLY